MLTVANKAHVDLSRRVPHLPDPPLHHHFLFYHLQPHHLLQSYFIPFFIRSFNKYLLNTYYVM